jgi:hypothetical protein
MTILSQKILHHTELNQKDQGQEPHQKRVKVNQKENQRKSQLRKRALNQNRTVNIIKVDKIFILTG